MKSGRIFLSAFMLMNLIIVVIDGGRRQLGNCILKREARKSKRQSKEKLVMVDTLCFCLEFFFSSLGFSLILLVLSLISLLYTSI